MSCTDNWVEPSRSDARDDRRGGRLSARKREALLVLEIELKTGRDSPKLAHKAEEVARDYDGLAPDTPHALHMPSHIFVRLGQWEETVEWNERSAEAALRQLDFDPHATAHYVHALDYMMYGYLQLADDDQARGTLKRVRDVEEVWPAPFAAYNVAAAQARYYLEQHKWEQGAWRVHCQSFTMRLGRTVPYSLRPCCGR
jgi:hypothetical protein